jgi:hypothetical protein
MGTTGIYRDLSFFMHVYSKTKLSLPGLSVWLWGPPLWEFLHCIAYFSDAKQIYDSEKLAQFFTLLYTILPCVYCRTSYGGDSSPGLLQKTIDTYGSIQTVVPKRQLTLFVYRLHEHVNKKLLMQKWKNFIEQNPPCSALQISADGIWDSLNSQPSLDIVYKRQAFTEFEPLNLNSLWLITLAFAQRTSKETEENTSCFLIILIQTLKASSFSSARNMGKLIETCGTNLHLLFQAYKIWLEEEMETQLKQDEFMHSTQQKLNLMMSSGCGRGTCK